LATINKSDYVQFKYGRPELHKISDSNVFGVTAEDKQSKRTTVREHFTGFKSEPAKQIKNEESGIHFGSADRAKTSVYGEDFKRTQPKVRSSKRRGTEVDFGVDFDHSTNYNTQFEGKSVGKMAAASFQDELELFSGKQDLNTIVRSDYKGHSKVGVERHRPKDQIEIPNEKMSMDTVTLGHFPAPTITAETAPDLKSAGKTALISSEAFDRSNIKMSSETSYKKEYDQKKMTKVDKFSHADEISGPTGDLDLATINKSDYVQFKYGRPELHKISDSNVFGVTAEDKQSKRTTVREHFTGFKSEPAKQIKNEESGIHFGSADRAKTSVYGEDFKRTQPKVRSSKRRGTEVDFGVDFDHSTNYNTQFEGKSVGKMAAASFQDELELFSGKQDLNTIVRSDYKGHSKVGVERHRPKDQIEIPNEKMSMDTVTLGHFPAPTITAETAPDLKSAGKTALTSSKAFDISNAMLNIKMSSDTSYKTEFDQKKMTKVDKFSHADEIPASTGDIDLATLHKSDYTKHSYGRPQIHKTKDNNVFGINYDVGRAGVGVQEVDDHGLADISVSRGSVGVVHGAEDMQIESLPASRESITVEEDKVAKVKSSRTKVKKEETSYEKHYKVKDGKVRSSKKTDATVKFGRDFYADTSYLDHYKSKACLVPTLDKLDEYTFKDIQGGHKIYTINCGCPPKGACGCTPPPTPAVKA